MPYYSKAVIGQEGEDIACRWLREKGYLLRDRNWRSGYHEIDIIAERHGIIHIIEVRTRRAGGWITPEQTITPKKAAALRRAASAYLALHRILSEVEFDLIAIDHFPDGTHDIRFIPEIL